MINETVSFEYISSGMNMVPGTVSKTIPESMQQWVVNEFKNLNGYKDIKYGMLFNAFTEEGLGGVIKDRYEGIINSIHADSGGLQLITRGMSVDDTIRKNIYKVQSKYSDIAMSFDEIPVEIIGKTSSRLDISNRYFNRELMKTNAKQSGINLRTQLETFAEEKSKTKPLLIAQGNCLETYQEWCDLMLAEIPHELQKNIGGMAMGAAALGQGLKEHIERTFIFTQLELPSNLKNHLHLLAVGTNIKLLPVFLFVNNGIINNTHISFDSTTQSSALMFGRFIEEMNERKIPRHYGELEYQYVLDRVNKLIDNPLEMTTKEFYDSLTSTNSKEKEAGRNPDNVNYAQVAYLISNLKMFFNTVSSLTNSNDKVVEYSKRYNMEHIFHSLSLVKNKEDFMEWDRHTSMYLPSKKVKTSDYKIQDIEDLF